MILMSGYLLGDIPFRQVYLHGLVRDGQGRKMSKSLGNIIDPLEMIAKYGTDALRLSLVMGTAAGTDSRISEDKIRGYKHFANKLWNIGRFVLTNTTELAPDENPPLTDSDQKHLTELSTLVGDITPQMDDYRFYLAGERLYHYVWHTFADIIIEEAKEHLRSPDDQIRRSAQSLLRQIFYTSLKLLHPFMPFITEELWSLAPHAPDETAPLIVSAWPTT
jgi:valyl-tRNA synthetase